DTGPVLGHEDVRRFEISVHQATLVDGLQTFGQSKGQGGEFRLLEWAVLPHSLFQGRAGYKGSGDPWWIILGGGGHYLCRVEATHSPGYLGLPGKACPELGIIGELGANDLHNRVSTARCSSQIHLAHTTITQFAFQVITAEAPGIVRL